MQDNLPIIDLEGYQRLRSLERKLARSPVSVALALAAWGGLLLAAVSGFVLSITDPFPHESTVVTIFVASLVSGAAAGLSRAYLFYRLARLRCPQCGRVLSRHVADVAEAERGRWWRFCGVSLGGRLYSPPVDDGDTRPWVRLMNEVRACVPCRAYVDYAEPHPQTCSEEELEQLHRHGSSRRQESRA